MRLRGVILYAVEIIFGIVEIFLLMRFLLKLLAANPNAAFVSWVYDMSGALIQPFRGMFPSPVLEQGVILEFSTLFAVLVYAMLAWIIIELINFFAVATKQTKR